MVPVGHKESQGHCRISAAFKGFPEIFRRCLESQDNFGGSNGSGVGIKGVSRCLKGFLGSHGISGEFHEVSGGASEGFRFIFAGFRDVLCNPGSRALHLASGAFRCVSWGFKEVSEAFQSL